MIIKNEQSNVTIIGDVQENKVSIDPKNLEYITTLLSSNLYSYPEESFMREIISNAWDSHVEAGNTDKAVIVTFDDNWVSIRDYGTGLSPERFNEIYKFIGSSTKRKDNTTIGGFGIGRMSALACSNACYITSYYNNTKYEYLMIKDGNTINIDLLHTSSTDEANGLKVAIKVPFISNYTRALDKLILFPNVYVHSKQYSSSCVSYNNSKYKVFDNFIHCPTIRDNYVALGHVLYPLDTYSLKDDNVRILYNYLCSKLHHGIVLKFDIGELTITPNRENILYSTDTIKKIEHKIVQCCNEITTLVYNRIPKSVNTYAEYCNYFSNVVFYNYIDNVVTSQDSKESICVSNVLLSNRMQALGYSFPAYKNTDLGYDKIINIIQRVHYYNKFLIPGIIAVHSRGKFYNKIDATWHSSRVSRFGYSDYNTSRVVIEVPKNTRITADIKNYLQETYGSVDLVVAVRVNNIIDAINNDLKARITEDYDKTIVEELYTEFLKSAIYLDPQTNTEFLKFKEAKKEERKKNKTNTNTLEKIEFAICKGPLYYKSYFTAYSINEFIKKCNQEKVKDVPYIVTNPRDPYIDVILDIAAIKNYNVIVVPKKYLEYTDKIIGSIKPESILNFQNPLIKELYTFSHVYQYSQHFYLTNSNFKNYFEEKIRKKINKYFKLDDIYNGSKYISLRRFIREFPADRELDKEIVDLCKDVENTLNKYDSFSKCADEIGIQYNSIACTFFLMKKGFKIPYSQYKKYLNSCLKKLNYENN